MNPGYSLKEPSTSLKGPLVDPLDFPKAARRAVKRARDSPAVKDGRVA